MRVEFFNWFRKLVLGWATQCFQWGSWPLGGQLPLNATVWDSRNRQQLYHVYFFCFVEMCSSSKKPLAECIQTFIAMKKEPIAKYRENNGLKVHTRLLDLNLSSSKNAPSSRPGLGGLSLSSKGNLAVSLSFSHFTVSFLFNFLISCYG